LSCPSKFLKRESHKQKSYKFRKKNLCGHLYNMSARKWFP
jgi:hypothetical protein